MRLLKRPAFNAARAKTIADNETTQAEREGLNTAMRGTNCYAGQAMVYSGRRCR